MHRDLNTGAMALLLLSVCLPPQAQAQEAPPLEDLPAADVERLELNPGRGSLLVGGGEMLLEGNFRLVLGTQYQRTPLRMTLGDQRLKLIGHRLTTLVTGAFGVLSWLEVDVQLPLVVMQKGDDLTALGLRAPTSRGLGTPTVHARMGVLSQRSGDALDLSMDVGLGLPLGNAQVLAREPWPRLETHALFGRSWDLLRVTVDTGILLRVPGRLGPEAMTRSRQGQELRLGAALGTEGKGLRVEGALRAALAIETGRGSTEFLVGLRQPVYAWRDTFGVEVFGMGGVGLGSLPGTPGFRMLVGVAAGHLPPPPPGFRRATTSSGDMTEESSRKEGQRPRPLMPVTDPNDGP